MARSTKVYVVQTAEPDAELLGTFTVKHECITWLGQGTLRNVYVATCNDGLAGACAKWQSAADFVKGKHG